MRAKKVFEKFTEDSDPIKDMGIGFNCPIDFEKKDELIDYIISILPLILKTKTIPENILNQGGYINNKYFSQLSNYADKFLTYKGDNVYKWNFGKFGWVYYIRQILLQKGYEPDYYYKEDKIKHKKHGIAQY